MSHEPIDHPSPARARRRLLAWAIALVALLLLAAAWSFTPLRELIRPDQIADWLESVRHEPWAPLALLGGFLIGGLLVLPVTLMTVLTLTAFGPFLGFFYALAGATASGVLSFAIGRYLGRRSVEQLTGTRIHRISQRFGRHGLVTIALLRMMPVAHFTVVSLSAGASHVRARDFLLGTLLGMAPGLAAIAIVFDRIRAAAREPNTASVVAVLAVMAGIIAILLVLRSRLRRRRAA